MCVVMRFPHPFRYSTTFVVSAVVVSWILIFVFVYKYETRLRELESQIVNLKNKQPKNHDTFHKTTFSSSLSSISISHRPINGKENFGQKKILVTGGAGFVGSHLVDRLMLDGHQVIVCDNLSSGGKSNLARWLGNANFKFIFHNIVSKIKLDTQFDEIYHLASPASPARFMADPINTIKANTLGTINMLELAKKLDATILIASSSEVYGDPQIHPQNEDYWGNVNPFGPRSCYDEGKRISEALAYAYKSQYNVSVRIARIFNTYGPRMRVDDGRVISNFVNQALRNDSITIHGHGNQTRSFQYVSDLVDGLMKLMTNNDIQSPLNLGNPIETRIVDLANMIKYLIPQSNSSIKFVKSFQDDPKRRKPDSSKALKLLNWRPQVDLLFGLLETKDYFNKLSI